MSIVVNYKPHKDGKEVILSALILRNNRNKALYIKTGNWVSTQQLVEGKNILPIQYLDVIECDLKKVDDLILSFDQGFEVEGVEYKEIETVPDLTINLDVSGKDIVVKSKVWNGWIYHGQLSTIALN